MKGRHGHSTGKSLLEKPQGIIVTFLCGCCLCVAHPSALSITTFQFVNCLGFECFLFVSDCVQWRVYAFCIVVHTRAATRCGSYTVKMDEIWETLYIWREFEIYRWFTLSWSWKMKNNSKNNRKRVANTILGLIRDGQTLGYTLWARWALFCFKACKWNQLGAQFILSIFRQFYL
jgi:hypothetical protein